MRASERKMKIGESLLRIHRTKLNRKTRIYSYDFNGTDKCAHNDTIHKPSCSFHSHFHFSIVVIVIITAIILSLAVLSVCDSLSSFSAILLFGAALRIDPKRKARARRRRAERGERNNNNENSR